MVTCYRNQLKTAPDEESRALILLMWKMSHEDISNDDLIDIYKEETGKAPQS